MGPYSTCLLCNRNCKARRDAGDKGLCGETASLRIAFAGIHCGEEPPLARAQGTGSGTIFVTGCNLRCAFCQNYQISKQAMGREVSQEEFIDICLALQDKGADNINIVTGSHTAPAIIYGITEARKQGLFIPLLWNSSGYDGQESLEILKDHVDVFLPDLKTLDPLLAEDYFSAPDYPEQAARAILKMIEYREIRFDEDALVSGVMIRHLIMPGRLENTRQVLAWYAEHCKGQALLSLMTQYTPVGSGKIPGRYVSKQEYDAVLSLLNEFDIHDGYCQDLVTGSDWLPDFNRQNPFSSDLSQPIWHWKQGLLD